MGLPRTIRLIWLGTRLPALAWLCVRSLLTRAGADAVVLHGCDAPLADDPLVRNLLTQKGFSLDLTPPALDDLPPVWQRRLRALWQKLDQPAAKADLLRLQILWAYGGLYVDTDVVCLGPLDDVWLHDGVVGLEQIALPADVVHSRSPEKWLRAGLLVGARELVRRLPQANQHFAAIADHYDLACNNAVMGFAPASPVLRRLLQRVVELPDAKATSLYELGPRLLEAETANQSMPGLTVLPPPHFYPLAPEICGVVLKRRGSAQPLWPDARSSLVHLYDSVLARQLGGPLDAAWLVGPGRASWLGEWLAPWLPELAELTHIAWPKAG